MDSDPRTSRRRDVWVRATLLLLCLLLSIDALALVSRWRSNRDRLSEILSELASDGVRDGEENSAAGRVAFERTPHHAKLTVARALVYQVLASSSAGGRSAAVRHLPVARELALEVLSQQPNNWQASMFLGASTYLDWSSTSDRRLYTAAAEWEQPLLTAIEEARGQHEPRRFLVAAYLETWTALSEAKKAHAFDLVTALFREDPSSFNHLGPVWLEVTGDLESALEVVPDQPGPWQALKKSFAGKQDWSSFTLAHGRYLDALRAEHIRNLDEATERLRLGDIVTGRQMCLTVVANSPRDGRFVDLVTRALELYPPGLHGLRAKDVLDAWLRWALELNSIGMDPLNPKVINRLTDAIGDLDAPTGAHAALIAGDAYHIQRYERLEESKKRREWAPFLIAKTEWLIEREDLASASRALGEVHLSARSLATYWQARHSLARATGDLSDVATAEEQLATFRSLRWRASDWRWRGRRIILEIHPQASSSGLAITINKAPARGAVAEFLLDGTSVAVRPVTGRQTVELAMEVEAKPHLLEVRSLAGGEIHPGPVELLAPREASPR